MSVAVLLTSGEMMVAYQVAALRCTQNRVRGVQDRFGAPPGAQGDALQIMACLSELAVCKHMNLWWSGLLGNTKERDVGSRIEVRAVETPDRRLVLHATTKDEPSLPYVLAVVGKAPTITLMGWCYGHQGQRPEFWTDPQRSNRHAFFVPHEHLNDMESLA